MSEEQTFDEMVNQRFEVWFCEYRLTQSSNVDLFRDVFQRAYLAGWIACEKFYEVENG